MLESKKIHSLTHSRWHCSNYQLNEQNVKNYIAAVTLDDVMFPWNTFTRICVSWNLMSSRKIPSDFWVLWPRTKCFVETFILKLPWNPFRRNPSVQQFDGSSKRKANLIYLKIDLMIGTSVENSVFTKYP